MQKNNEKTLSTMESYNCDTITELLPKNQSLLRSKTGDGFGGNLGL